MTTRYCIICKQNKPEDTFPQKINYWHGEKYVTLRSFCQECYLGYLATYRETYKERAKERQKVFDKRHPDRSKVYAVANDHKSEIKKEACERCGSRDKLHMHHEDYSQPLEVNTLCVGCHERVHHA